MTTPDSELKILDAVWYTPLGGPVIGIVTVDTGYEIKTYIGVGEGRDAAVDAQMIAARGARFR